MFVAMVLYTGDVGIPSGGEEGNRSGLFHTHRASVFLVRTLVGYSTLIQITLLKIARGTEPEDLFLSLFISLRVTVSRRRSSATGTGTILCYSRSRRVFRVSTAVRARTGTISLRARCAIGGERMTLPLNVAE